MENVLPYKWLLALDILKRQYDVLPSQRLLASYTEDMEKMPTFEIHLFGQIGYMTIDPKNIERPDRGLSSSDSVVDLQPAFFRFTLVTTTALIFGEPASGLTSADHETFAESFDYASMISAIRLRLADLEWVYKPKAFRKACQVVKEYASHFVDEALKSRVGDELSPRTESEALIQDLYAELQDPELVRDQLVHVLIAGRDTTVCLMSWAVFLLVRHPAKLARLKQEIQSTLPNRERLIRSQLQKMTYLRAVLNESRWP
ncbi:MAG: hypothetical protein Q9176_007151 [Flavoplaca citrina]